MGGKHQAANKTRYVAQPNAAYRTNVRCWCYVCGTSHAWEQECARTSKYRESENAKSA